MNLMESRVLQFPKFNKAKVNENHLKIRGLLNSTVDGMPVTEKYTITTALGDEFALAPGNEQTFCLKSYVGKIILATGIFIPELHILHLATLALPNLPIGSSGSKSNLEINPNNVFQLNQISHLFSAATTAA